MNVVLVLLIAALSAFGQQPHAAITPDEFMSTFQAGFRVTQLLGKQGLRYTETRGDRLLTVETDRRGTARVSYSMNGIVQSEGIVHGDRVYERTGQGPWIIRTQAEYKAELTALSELLIKARAENDHETYKRVFDETRKRIFVQASVPAMEFAIFWRGFRINSTMQSFASPGVENKVLTELGPSEHKERAVRLHRFTGDRQNVPYGRLFRKHRIGVEYWFEKKTGAVVKIRTLNEWSSDVETAKEIVVHEWEIDPNFEIKVPIAGEGR